MQDCSAPLMNEPLLVSMLVVLYHKPNGTKKAVLCNREVVCVGKNNVIDIDWNKEYLR